MEIHSTYVSKVLKGTYPRLDHEAFEALDTSFMERYEMLLIPRDHASIKSHVYKALSSCRIYFDIEVFDTRRRR